MKFTHEDLLKNGYKLVFEDDFNGDSVVNSVDIIKLIKILLGIYD